VWHLSDPHAQEYGVSGHLQSGIDIISRRNGDLSRRVGVQCKHVKKLKIADIREDTNAALAIDPPLSEMIFATTDDSDPKIIAFAAQLEQEIRTDGRVIQSASTIGRKSNLSSFSDQICMRSSILG
jgi:hypothetical protein